MEEEGGFEDTVIEEEVHRIVAQEMKNYPRNKMESGIFPYGGKK